jgi:heme exporter protein D
MFLFVVYAAYFFPLSLYRLFVVVLVLDFKTKKQTMFARPTGLILSYFVCIKHIQKLRFCFVFLERSLSLFFSLLSFSIYMHLSLVFVCLFVLLLLYTSLTRLRSLKKKNQKERERQEDRKEK